MFGFKNKLYIKALLRKAKKYDLCEAEKYNCEALKLVKSAEAVEQKKLGLKLAVMSDTHGDMAFGNRLEEYINTLPDYDLFVILGDIHSAELDKIIELVPEDKIVALRGNHDSPDIYDKYKIKNINGKMISCKGVKLAGIEGSFRYKNGPYPMYTHYESLKLAEKIPMGADVLLTHDCAFKEATYDMAHSGLMGITYYIYSNKVKWHIHGHIHKSYKSEYENNTIEKSVYMCEYIEI